MRLFVAIPMPADIRQKLARLQFGLKGARWVEDGGLHLTLAFIGEVDPPTAADIDGALAQVTSPPFTLTIADMGSYGHPPKMVWTGVTAEPADALGHLQANVVSALSRLGLELEKRKFSPHITLARFKGISKGKLADYMESHGGLKLAPFPVTHFTLLRSHLSASGAHYEPLQDYSLS